jgi:hypothetical protein
MDQMKFYGPAPERNEIVDEFWRSSQTNFYTSEREKIHNVDAFLGGF